MGSVGDGARSLIYCTSRPIRLKGWDRGIFWKPQLFAAIRFNGEVPIGIHFKKLELHSSRDNSQRMSCYGYLLPLIMLTYAIAYDTANASEFRWTRIPDIPDPIGFKGMYAGLTGDHLMIAGGSQFITPLREGGAKVFNSKIWIRSINAEPDEPWLERRESLPRRWGEGCSVTTPFGVVCIGGFGDDGPTADVLLVSLDLDSDTLNFHQLPDLPFPLGNGSASYRDGTIYLLGSFSDQRPIVLSLQVELAIKGQPGGYWNIVTLFEGTSRHAAFLALLEDGSGERLYLFGGRAAGNQTPSQADYLNEVWRYDEQLREWEPMALMPHAALIPVHVQIDSSTLAVMGGSDGHNFGNMAAMGANYRIPSRIMFYDAKRDKWSVRGDMPVGLVGAAVVDLGGSWMMAGGEYSPALRTNRAYQFDWVE